MEGREGVMPGWWGMLAGVMLLVGMGLVGGRGAGGVGLNMEEGQDVLPVISLSTPTGTCTPSWQVVTSPNFSDTTNYLSAVAAISANDIWAVGTYSYPDPPVGYAGSATLTLHWDGQGWTRIPSPSVGTQYDSNVLLGVVAVSSNDVWAVGDIDTDAPGTLTLIEHWDGVQWSIVPSPSIANTTQQLFSVSSVSSNDVWAVGYYTAYSGDAGYLRTLTQHWDGSQWSSMPSPNIGTDHNEFWAVSALSTDNVWAVGYYVDQEAGYTLVEHWDGTQWSVVSSPNPCTSCGNTLYGVDATSGDDVWAVGTTRHSGGGEDTLVEHWDGSQWSIVGSPNGNSSHNELDAVSAISSTDIWAVGYSGSAALLEHWDGNEWSIVPSPSGGYLWGVAAMSSTDVWAVGELRSCQGGPCSWRTLTEHYSAPCASATPTTTPSPSPSPMPSLSPTRTPMPVLVGHVNWEARPSQPNQLQVLPVTLTLKMGNTEVNYPMQVTDEYGFFTVTVGGLLSGRYGWRVDDAALGLHSANYLAGSGVVDIGGGVVTRVEMGLMRAGDANDDDRVSVGDFNVLKVSFGSGCGDPAYDGRADFTGDCAVNVSDFSALKRNFGREGAPPIGPGAR